MSNFLADDLQLAHWYDNYRHLSGNSHSNGNETLIEWIKLNTHGQKEPIQNIRQRNQNKVEILFNYMQFTLWAYLLIAKELLVIREDLPELSELYDNFYATEEAFSILVSLSPNKFGKQMHGDLLKVIAKAKSKSPAT